MSQDKARSEVPASQPGPVKRPPARLALALFLPYALDILLVALAAWRIWGDDSLVEAWTIGFALANAIPALIVGVGLIFFLSGRAWQDRATRHELFLILAAPLIPLSALCLWLLASRLH